MAFCYIPASHDSKFRMKILIVMAAVAMVLSGCAGQVWKATGSTDEFTDQTTMMVTVGEYTTVPVIVTKPFNYYPVVRKIGPPGTLGLQQRRTATCSYQ